MDFKSSLEPRYLTELELGTLPVEEGEIKIVVLDGITGKSSIVNCPRHGDVIAQTHGGKFKTIVVHAEYRV